MVVNIINECRHVHIHFALDRLTLALPCVFDVTEVFGLCFVCWCECIIFARQTATFVSVSFLKLKVTFSFKARSSNNFFSSSLSLSSSSLFRMNIFVFVSHHLPFIILSFVICNSQFKIYQQQHQKKKWAKKYPVFLSVFWYRGCVIILTAARRRTKQMILLVFVWMTAFERAIACNSMSRLVWLSSDRNGVIIY